MNSFFVCHKELHRFSPTQNPAKEAPLGGPKEEARLLPRHWSTRKTPSHLGLAQRGGLARRGWLSVFSMLAIGFVWLAPPLRAQFAYVANFNSANVSAYSIAADGALVPIPGSPFPAENGPASVAVDPTGKFAYLANFNNNTVSAYSIGADGALTLVTGSPFAAGNAPPVAVDPKGKFAYVANFDDNTVSAYSIAADGTLTLVTGSPFAAGSAPASVAVDPTGKFAYVANTIDNTVSAYSIAADGALTLVTGSPFAAGSAPILLAITPLVPFFASFAKLEIESELSTFHLSDSFALGANSNGITPTTQKLTLQIGTFSVTIPSGSFTKTATGTFICKSTINGVSLNLKIVPLGANIFTFNVNGGGINLGGLTEPVTVVLTIGIDSGTFNVAHYTQ